MNAKELSVFMAEHASAIVEHLLPQGKKAGKEWKVGGVGGEAGGSMSVCLSRCEARRVEGLRNGRFWRPPELVGPMPSNVDRGSNACRKAISRDPRRCAAPARA